MEQLMISLQWLLFSSQSYYLFHFETFIYLRYMADRGDQARN